VEVLLHQIQVLSEHSTVYPDGVRYLRGESGDVGEWFSAGSPSWGLPQCALLDHGAPQVPQWRRQRVGVREDCHVVVQICRV